VCAFSSSSCQKIKVLKLLMIKVQLFVLDVSAFLSKLYYGSVSSSMLHPILYIIVASPELSVLFLRLSHVVTIFVLLLFVIHFSRHTSHDIL